MLRVSTVVNCQLIVACCSLRAVSQAAISEHNVSSSGIRSALPCPAGSHSASVQPRWCAADAVVSAGSAIGAAATAQTVDLDRYDTLGPPSRAAAGSAACGCPAADVVAEWRAPEPGSRPHACLDPAVDADADNRLAGCNPASHTGAQSLSAAGSVFEPGSLR